MQYISILYGIRKKKTLQKTITCIYSALEKLRYLWRNIRFINTYLNVFGFAFYFSILRFGSGNRGDIAQSALISNISLFRSKEGEEDKILILDRPILPPNMGNKLGNKVAHK